MGRIRVNLSTVMGSRKVRSLRRLSIMSGLDRISLSHLWHETSGGIKFSTLAKLCEVLNCTPGDLLTYEPDPQPKEDHHQDHQQQPQQDQPVGKKKKEDHIGGQKK